MKALALITLILLAGCSGSNPVLPIDIEDPTTTADPLRVDFSTSWASLEASTYWDGYINYDGTGYQDAHGAWEGEDVYVGLTFGFNPEHVHSISSQAPVGCDLVVICGFDIGDPSAPGAQVVDGVVVRMERP